MKKPTPRKKVKPRTMWGEKHEAFLNMNGNQCRYPSDEEAYPPFTYCLRPVLENRSYCAEHAKICYARGYVPRNEDMTYPSLYDRVVVKSGGHKFRATTGNLKS